MSEEVEKTPEAQDETPATPPNEETGPIEPEPAEQESEPAEQESEPVEQESEPAEQKPEPEPVSPKGVSFNNDSLTFDEAQQEINSMKEKAGAARESLRSGPTSYSCSSFTPSHHSSDDTPKSKNMLSHLNSESAMLNYKVQTARSLVRKQEDLLRNLARMRENMERSEVELGKATDYYGRSKVFPQSRYQMPKSYSVPRREPSPLSNFEVPDTHDQLSDVGSGTYRSPIVPRSRALIEVSAYQPRQTSVPRDYGLDEDFEREMSSLRKRVTDLTRKATEATSSSGRNYGYYDTSAYLKGYEGDGVTEPMTEAAQ